MIVDTHAHCYPEKVWPKVKAAIEGRYGVASVYEATVDGLHAAMGVSGVDLSVVLPVANRPEHVRSVNEWALGAREGRGDLLFFGAMHPGVADPAAEVEWLSVHGFKGVKMQPNAGCYYPNDKGCMEVYKALEGHGMILVTHAGDELKPFEPLYAHPRNFIDMLKKHPGLTVVMAHLGGYKTWDDLDAVLGYDNVYYDTAMSLEMGDEKFADIVERIGIDRVLFGTDFPWYDTKKAKEKTKGLLGSKAKKVFEENPKRLLGL